MKFSVLIPVYAKENPEFFIKALNSIVTQTLKPSEIVVVKDGPLTDGLEKVIELFSKNYDNLFKIVSLEENVGLGDALNIGLKKCSYELVARMDSDDISMPYRFEKQIQVFDRDNKLDVCSGWVGEFDKDEKEIYYYRKVPENHDDIVRYLKIRSAINHPAVMYKKTSVEKAGGYQKMMFLEDYYLWVRMLLKGAKFYNIQEVLVNMRGGENMIKRRAGIAYAKSELKLLNEFKNIGFLTKDEYIRNIFIRVPIRLMPIGIIKFIYRFLRTKKINSEVFHKI